MRDTELYARVLLVTNISDRKENAIVVLCTPLVLPAGIVSDNALRSIYGPFQYTDIAYDWAVPINKFGLRHWPPQCELYAERRRNALHQILTARAQSIAPDIMVRIERLRVTFETFAQYIHTSWNDFDEVIG